MVLFELAIDLFSELFFIGGSPTPRATLIWLLVIAVPVGWYAFGPSSMGVTLPLSYLAYRIHKYAS